MIWALQPTLFATEHLDRSFLAGPRFESDWVRCCEVSIKGADNQVYLKKVSCTREGAVRFRVTHRAQNNCKFTPLLLCSGHSKPRSRRSPRLPSQRGQGPSSVLFNTNNSSNRTLASAEERQFTWARPTCSSRETALIRSQIGCPCRHRGDCNFGQFPRGKQTAPVLVGG